MPEEKANPESTVEKDGNEGEARFKPYRIKVKGQEIEVQDEKKAIELMQKGAAFEENQRLSKEERRKEKEELEADRARLEPLRQVDDLLRQDHVKRAKVNAILQDRPLPQDDADDDPVLNEVRRLNQRLDRLESGVSQEVGGLKGGLTAIRRGESLRMEERALRKTYPKLANDERIAEAFDQAEKTGQSLKTAFRDLFFDDVMEFTREETLGEFGVDPALRTERSDVPVLDGIGPLDDTARARILADPELYARFKPQMIADRLKRTGKQRALGREE